MSIWDNWEKRKKRRAPFFPNVDRLIDEMEKEMAEFFKEVEKEIPRDMATDTILPDGSHRKEYGPFVYGYSVKIGPDGKPVIREFGNLKPDYSGEAKQPYSLQDAREPLVDVVEDREEVKVIAELPGVEKEEIDLYATSRSLTINVSDPGKRFYKVVELPSDVDESSASSTYRNGVLETVLRKQKSVGPGKSVPIQ